MSRVARRQERSTAVAVGTLYVLATLAGVAAAIAQAPTTIDEMAGNRASVLASAGSLAVMAVAVTGVGVMLYPVLAADATTSLRRGLAAWYAASRVIEGALFMVAVATLLAMLAAAEGPTRGGDPTTGVAMNALFDYSFVAGQTVFSLGALFLYWLLLVSGRVPRWLAVWGLVAAPMMLVGGPAAAGHRRPELGDLVRAVRAAGPAGDGPRGVAHRVGVPTCPCLRPGEQHRCSPSTEPQDTPEELTAPPSQFHGSARTLAKTRPADDTPAAGVLRVRIKSLRPRSARAPSSATPSGTTRRGVTDVV